MEKERKMKRVKVGIKTKERKRERTLFYGDCKEKRNREAGGEWRKRKRGCGKEETMRAEKV
jgi:hypothetical protein